MTNHLVRLYALALSMLVFFLAWAGIAAHPWKSTTAAPAGSIALATYQQRLQTDAQLVQQLIANKHRAAQTATAATSSPTVRVVTLPPLTATHTS